MNEYTPIPSPVDSYVFDCCAAARWIAAESGLPVETTHKVLQWEVRYLMALGVINGGPDPLDHPLQGIR